MSNMSLAVGLVAKVVGGGKRADQIKNYTRRKILKSTEGTCCRIILVGIFVVLLVIASLIAFLITNVFIMGIPNAILIGALWLFKKVWSDDFFIATFFKVLTVTRDFFRVLLDIWNTVATLGPPLALFWNVVWDFISAVFTGIYGVICTESIFSPSFNIFTSCPAVMNLLTLAPNLATLVQSIISFAIELFGLIEASLKSVACFDRTGAFITSLTVFGNGAVSVDCSTFCFEVMGISLPGCYNFGNLMRWLFPANIAIVPQRFGKFIANLIDMTMPFVWDVFRWVAFRGGVSEIYTCSTLNCMVDVLFVSPSKIFKVAWGIVIDYILAPITHTTCTIFTDQAPNCIAQPLCGWMGFPAAFCNAIPTSPPGYCVCSQALTGWDKSFGYVNSFVSGSPCSLTGICHPVYGWLVAQALVIYNAL